MGRWGALYHIPRALSKGTVCKQMIRRTRREAVSCGAPQKRHRVPEPGIVSPPFLAPPLGLTGCYLPLSSIFGFFAR